MCESVRRHYLQRAAFPCYIWTANTHAYTRPILSTALAAGDTSSWDRQRAFGGHCACVELKKRARENRERRREHCRQTCFGSKTNEFLFGQRTEHSTNTSLIFILNWRIYAMSSPSFGFSIFFENTKCSFRLFWSVNVAIWSGMRLIYFDVLNFTWNFEFQ